MKFSMKMIVMATAAMFLTTGLAIAGPEKDPLKARVPADKRAAAKKDKSPYGKNSQDATPEIIAEGKAIFEGKGTCVNCHGKDGDGQGPAGKVLNPGPRRLHQLQISQETERGRTHVGDQKWQPRHRNGSSYSSNHQRRRRLESDCLRKKFL